MSLDTGNLWQFKLTIGYKVKDESMLKWYIKMKYKNEILNQNQLIKVTDWIVY